MPAGDNGGLFETMQNRYGETEEFGKWAVSVVKRGLSAAERYLIDKYLTRKGGMVLEIGCGGGRIAIPLSLQGYRVTGIDLVDKMVHQAAQNASACGAGASFEVGNACELKYEDDSFDYVLMLAQVIGHIPLRTNRIGALREAKRVLRSGGLVITSTSSRDARLKYRLYFKVVNALMRIYNPFKLEPNDAFMFRTDGKLDLIRNVRQRVIFHWYSSEEFIADAKEAGLELVEWGTREEIEERYAMPDADHGGWGALFYVLKKPATEE